MRVDRLVEAVAKVGLDDTLAAKLDAARAKLLDAKRALAANAPGPGAVQRQAAPEQVAALASRLDEVARLRPERAKAALATARVAFQNSTASLAIHPGGRFDGDSRNCPYSHR